MAKSITQALFARALRSRSPLQRWLSDNYDEVASVLVTQDPPRWEDLAAVARDHGVLDAKGKPPTRHAVRASWKGLEARKGKPAPSETPEPAPYPLQAVQAPERPQPRSGLLGRFGTR